ncbi:MAG: hypothetical protein HN348_20175, partial [Proteobacteria bacterium]|nr:hypothetical protein [Pseudomonadota bacterium]
MRIKSKYMTANMRITNVRREGKDLVVEGLVKEFMPMVVKVDFDDVKAMSKVMARRRPRLRQSLRDMVSRIGRPREAAQTDTHDQGKVMDFTVVEERQSSRESPKT